MCVGGGNVRENESDKDTSKMFFIKYFLLNDNCQLLFIHTSHDTMGKIAKYIAYYGLFDRMYLSLIHI